MNDSSPHDLPSQKLAKAHGACGRCVSSVSGAGGGVVSSSRLQPVDQALLERKGVQSTQKDKQTICMDEEGHISIKPGGAAGPFGISLSETENQEREERCDRPFHVKGKLTVVLAF